MVQCTTTNTTATNDNDVGFRWQRLFPMIGIIPLNIFTDMTSFFAKSLFCANLAQRINFFGIKRNISSRKQKLRCDLLSFSFMLTLQVFCYLYGNI